MTNAWMYTMLLIDNTTDGGRLSLLLHLLLCYNMLVVHLITIIKHNISTAFVVYILKDAILVIIYYNHISFNSNIDVANG